MHTHELEKVPLEIVLLHTQPVGWNVRGNEHTRHSVGCLHRTLLAQYQRTIARGDDVACSLQRDTCGSAITRVLSREWLPFVVIERDRPRFEAVAASGQPALLGDAADDGVLARAGIADASLLIVATPDSFRARRVLELAREARPGIPGVVRTHSDGELDALRGDPANHVVMGERELARTMLMHVLRQFGVPPERARLLVEDPSSSALEAEAERR